MQLEVDVAIIGAGTAGIVAAEEVKKATDSFVIINGGEFGTTCARVGCMPSKALLQVAHDSHARGRMAREGVLPRGVTDARTSEAMAHVRRLRDRFVANAVADFERRFAAHSIHGWAEFLAPDMIKVDATQIKAAKGIVVATGSRPLVPAHWKEFQDDILTSDDVFELKELPESVAVIGLGVNGVEFAQAFARLGVDVVAFEARETVGELTDPEVNARAVTSFAREFEIVLGDEATITRDGKRLRVSAKGTSRTVDKVLASLGRRPNLETLGLDAIGIRVSDGRIERFSEDTTQVGDSRIFLAGDVDAHRPTLHEAALEGRIAGHNCVRARSEYFSRPAPLSISFTDPQLAVCGFPGPKRAEREALAGGADFSESGYALIRGGSEGLLRVYADPRSGRILGAEMACLGAEHLAHLIAWSVQRMATVRDLLDLPFYHPTLEETVRTAVADLARALDERASRTVRFPESFVTQGGA